MNKRSTRLCRNGTLKNPNVLEYIAERQNLEKLSVSVYIEELAKT